MIDVSRIENSYKIVMSEPYEGVKQMRLPISICLIELIEDKELGDLIKIRTSTGEVLHLHYGVGVSINSEICSSNQMILDKIDLL